MGPAGRDSSSESNDSNDSSSSESEHMKVVPPSQQVANTQGGGSQGGGSQGGGSQGGSSQGSRSNTLKLANAQMKIIGKYNKILK